MDSSVYAKLVEESYNYRKGYLDYLTEKYVNEDSDSDSDYLIDIRTLKIVKFEGQEPRIPEFGRLHSYSCKATQQFIREEKKRIRLLKINNHKISVTTKEVSEYAQQFICKGKKRITHLKKKRHKTSVKTKEVSECDIPEAPGQPKVIEFGPNFANIAWTPPTSDGGKPITGYIIEKRELSYPDWYKVNTFPAPQTEFHITNLYEGKPYQFRVTAVNEGGPGKPSKPSNPITAKQQKLQSFTELSNDENEDIDTSKSKFPICGKKTASIIAVRKNPGFKRNLDFLKSCPVDDLSFKSRSLSEISNSNKKVCHSSISSSSTDKQIKNKYPVETKLQTPQIPVDDSFFKSSSLSKRSNSNKASNSSTTCFNKWKTGQYNEEIVKHISKTLYSNIKINTTYPTLKNYSGAYECSANFYESIIHAKKIRYPFYHKSKNNYKLIDEQKIDECPIKNGLSIINYATKSSNNSYSVKLGSKGKSCLENSKKIVEKKFSTCKRNANKNIVCDNNTIKVARVNLRKFQYKNIFIYA